MEIKPSELLKNDFFKDLRFYEISGTPAQQGYLLYGGDQALQGERGQIRSLPNFSEFQG